MTLETYTPPSNFPYLVGVYLAINALPDAYLYVDGPDCSFYKAQFIHGKHDLQSTLIRADGNHRIRMSDVTVNQIVEDRTPALTATLKALNDSPECAVILVSSMPMATITGTQYDLIIRELAPDLDKPLLEVPSLSLSGDWLDGYAHTLTTLAKGLELVGEPEPGTVALVGYLMDRNERDHGANIEELERLLTGLGLDPVSVWLSGRPTDHLAQAGRAETIVSLPHGREAARILAERTGARLIEAGVPLGLKGTVDWISDIANAVGRQDQGAELLNGELGRVVPALQWLIPQYFQGLRLLFVGDPLLFESATEFWRELGCDVVGLVGVGRQGHLETPPESLASIPTLFEANPYDMEGLVSGFPEDRPLDLCIQSDTFGWQGQGDYVVVPFGLSCYWWHAIYDAPYLGFSGALSLADRMANRLMTRYKRRK